MTYQEQIREIFFMSPCEEFQQIETENIETRFIKKECLMVFNSLPECLNTRPEKVSRTFARQRKGLCKTPKHDIEVIRELIDFVKLKRFQKRF